MKTCINGATTMPYSFAQDIKSASVAGFDGVEIWTSKLKDYLEEHSIEDAKELLDANNVQAAALCPWDFSFFGDVDVTSEAVEDGAKIAEKLDCDTLLVTPDVPPESMSEAEAITTAGKVGRKYAEITQDYGVHLALEPLGNHPFVPGAKEAMAIIEVADHDYMGMMMDTFHYYKSNVPIEEIDAIPNDKLFIVHVNDCEDRPREELKDSHRLYTGLGVIPLSEMLGTIKRNGYEGYLSVEIFRREYWDKDPETISKEAKKYLDKLLKKLL